MHCSNLNVEEVRNENTNLWLMSVYGVGYIFKTAGPTTALGAKISITSFGLF